MNRRQSDPRYQLKIAEGVERNAAWRALTPHAQIQSLDRRLGRGVGARRQRTRITQPSTIKAEQP